VTTRQEVIRSSFMASYGKADTLVDRGYGVFRTLEPWVKDMESNGPDPVRGPSTPSVGGLVIWQSRASFSAGVRNGPQQPGRRHTMPVSRRHPHTPLRGFEAYEIRLPRADKIFQRKGGADAAQASAD
jgi:hypothetical protein